MKRKILVAIDMQNDFIDGSLGTKEAKQIVQKAIDKIKSYDSKDIYATRDTHFENYLETNEGRNLPVMHCIKGSKGWEIRHEIMALLSNAVIIDKPIFGSFELADMLYDISKIDEIEIELIGLCTDICVVANAILLKTKMPEINISIDSSCCAGTTPEMHRAAIDTMKMCQINVI